MALFLSCYLRGGHQPTHVVDQLGFVYGKPRLRKAHFECSRCHVLLDP